MVQEAATDIVAAGQADGVDQPAVFLIRPLGFITPTSARRITHADSLAFQAVHEKVYREHGFTLLDVPAAPPASRADLLESTIAGLTGA